MSTAPIAPPISGHLSMVERASEAPNPWNAAGRRFLADRWAVAGPPPFLLVVHVLALAAPWVIPNLLHRSAFRQRMNDVVRVAGADVEVVSEDGIPIGPSAAFPLGADLAGRDVLSRAIYGSRVSLLVATLGTLFALLMGLAAGLLAGLYRGPIDTVISRFIDAMMSIPVLLLAIALASVLRGGSVWAVVLILALVNWTYLARIIRGGAVLRDATSSRRRARWARAIARSCCGTCCPTSWARSWCSPRSRWPTTFCWRARSASSVSVCSHPRPPGAT
jgi:ABC-type dipeptide/oligopeptide/nickel transport system permease subunit